MKALIFNGSKEEDASLKITQEAMESELKKMGWQVETLLLHEMNIAPCLGCFGCWIKTPGICVINDDGRIIPEKIVQSDLMVFLTSITFGGYSSELKKALDRAIPMLLPFFRKVNGETHHVMRYEKYPKLLVIGSLPK
ncbi:MAG: flavodoxin family protein, partial [Thermoplasmata archaeon]|nr:flavodoxin family protein [Thermoplasmata archaeon]